MLFFISWPGHMFHPSTPSIHPFVHSMSLYDRHTHSFLLFFFSFLSLSLSFTQDVIIRVSRKLFIILKLSSLFLFLSLISVNFWQWHPMNSCAIVILSKLGRFNHLRSINIYIYIFIYSILFAFDHGPILFDLRWSLPNFDRKFTRDETSFIKW